ncbi:MAG: phenylalanine--tRNA ligase subunit beta, partial [Bdellovibrionota bacterium]
TNYILMERGQPLHAFDADKVSGKIVVRKAVADEKILCLDEVEYTLTDADLVIADETGPIAIAGVMGGLGTAVTTETKNILLESAWFDPQVVRNTSKRLNITSESSKRFEREIDGSAVLTHGLMAAEMIKDYAGGKVIGTQSKGKLASQPHIVIVKKDAVVKSLGTVIENAHEYLIRLGFGVEKIDDGWKVMVPPRRPEIVREIDVIEEIARVYGYQNIPSALPPMDVAPSIDSRFSARQYIRQLMVGAGLQEAYTYSFGSQSDYQYFEELAAGRPVAIENPIIQEQSLMKTSLIANLIHVWKTNQARQVAAGRFFECGKVYFQSKGAPAEEERCGILLSGKKFEKSWLQGEIGFTYFDLKGIVEHMATQLSVTFEYKALTETACFHPGQSAEIILDGETVGRMGVLHPTLLANFDLQEDVLFAEITMEKLFALVTQKRAFQTYSIYPHVKRDLAFIVEEKITHKQVMACIDAINMPILHDFEVFDAYQGEGVAVGMKSLAYRFDFCSDSKTLKDKEVDKAIEQITKALASNVGAKLR